MNPSSITVQRQRKLTRDGIPYGRWAFLQALSGQGSSAEEGYPLPVGWVYSSGCIMPGQEATEAAWRWLERVAGVFPVTVLRIWLDQPGRDGKRKRQGLPEFKMFYQDGEGKTPAEHRYPDGFMVRATFAYDPDPPPKPLGWRIGSQVRHQERPNGPVTLFVRYEAALSEAILEEPAYQPTRIFVDNHYLGSRDAYMGPKEIGIPDFGLPLGYFQDITDRAIAADASGRFLFLGWSWVNRHWCHIMGELTLPCVGFSSFKLPDVPMPDRVDEILRAWGYQVGYYGSHLPEASDEVMGIIDEAVHCALHTADQRPTVLVGESDTCYLVAWTITGWRWFINGYPKSYGVVGLDSVRGAKAMLVKYRPYMKVVEGVQFPSNQLPTEYWTPWTFVVPSIGLSSED